MKRFLCVLSGLAIIAAATTANAQIDWAAGAPGGTSGGSIEVGGESGVSLDTGISATLVGGDLTAPVDYTISAWINTRRDNGFGEAAAAADAFTQELLGGLRALDQGQALAVLLAQLALAFKAGEDQLGAGA